MGSFLISSVVVKPLEREIRLEKLQWSRGSTKALKPYTLLQENNRSFCDLFYLITFIRFVLYTEFNKF